MEDNNKENNSKQTGGLNRDWGYVSSDVEKTDKNGKTILIYTSFEKNGKVNQYKDNGDGGHGHTKWNNREDFYVGKEPDYNRTESNEKSNPSEDEVESNGGCYLTTACMHHYKHNFDDKCFELEMLRWFRDHFVSKEDIINYYQNAPMIVTSIQKEKF